MCGCVLAVCSLDNSGHITTVELNTLAETRRKLGHMAGVWNEKKNAHLLNKIDSTGGYPSNRWPM